LRTHPIWPLTRKRWFRLRHTYSLRQSHIATPAISNMSLLEVLHDQYNTVAQKLRRLYSLYSERDDEVLLESINDTKKELRNIQHQIENETEKSKRSGAFVDMKKHCPPFQKRGII